MTTATLDRVMNNPEALDALRKIRQENIQKHEEGRDLEERHARRHLNLMIKRSR